MAKAQASIKNPAKDKVNPHFKSRYSDLATGLDVIRPALAAQGIAVWQVPQVVDDHVVLVTRLAHAGSGQWLEGDYPVSKIDRQQTMAAALTFAKRQALYAMVAVCGEDEDDDGNEANEAPPAPRSEPALARSAPKAKNSDELASVILGTLELCGSTDSLDEWLNSNRPAIDRLGDADKARVRLAYQTKRNALVEDEYEQKEAAE
jgi:hypothetical protein